MITVIEFNSGISYGLKYSIIFERRMEKFQSGGWRNRSLDRWRNRSKRGCNKNAIHLLKWTFLTRSSGFLIK